MVDERVSSDERVWPDGGADKEPVATTSEDQAKAAAQRLLDDAGLADGAQAVGPAGPRVEVQVDPEVDGLPTTGFGTTLVVAGDSVESGSGWLADTERRRRRTRWCPPARRGTQLVRNPLPMPLVACDQPLPEGTDPVPCGGPVTVTGARARAVAAADRRRADAAAGLAVHRREVDAPARAGRRRAAAAGAVRRRGSGGGVPGSSGTAVPPETPSADPGRRAAGVALHRGDPRQPTTGAST